MIEMIISYFLVANEYIDCRKNLPVVPKEFIGESFCRWSDTSSACTGCHSFDYLIETYRVRKLWHNVLNCPFIVDCSHVYCTIDKNGCPVSTGESIYDK